MRKFWRKGRQTLQAFMEVEASHMRESLQPVRGPAGREHRN